jgi:hypothetical protein
MALAERSTRALTRGCKSWRIGQVLEEFTHGYLEQLAKAVDGVQVHARRGLFVQQRDRVAVQPGLSGHIGDLELALAHQAGQMALDHVVLKEKTLSKTTKRLDVWHSAVKNVIQDDKKTDEEEICHPHCATSGWGTTVAGTTYLTTDELSARIKYDVRTIRERLKDSVLLEGTHYVRPFGGRKILFVWEAIERDMRAMASIDRMAIPMANGGVLHG